jgi:hypothetical protein
MGDSETEHVIALQKALAEKLNTLGFGGDPHSKEIVSHLAEIVARSRTLDDHAFPLLLSLDPERRRSTAELVLGIKAHLDAIQDAITDVQPALVALTDFLLREPA